MATMDFQCLPVKHLAILLTNTAPDTASYDFQVESVSLLLLTKLMLYSGLSFILSSWSFLFLLYQAQLGYITMHFRPMHKKAIQS